MLVFLYTGLMLTNSRRLNIQQRFTTYGSHAGRDFNGILSMPRKTFHAIKGAASVGPLNKMATAPGRDEIYELPASEK